MRLSQENEDTSRSQDRQPSSSPGTQTANLLKFKFSKKARIRTRRHYQKIYQEGRKLSGEMVGADLRLGRAECPKLGITVAKRHGKAHDRNYFKRVVREAFRHVYPQLPTDLELNISPRCPLAKITRAGIEADLVRFSQKFKK